MLLPLTKKIYIDIKCVTISFGDAIKYKFYILFTYEITNYRMIRFQCLYHRARKCLCN